MRFAVDAKQTDRRGHKGLRRSRRRALKARERLEGPLVADLPEGKRRVVEQRSIELGHRRERVERVGGAVVAHGLDDSAAKEVFSPGNLAHERLSHARVVAGRRG